MEHLPIILAHGALGAYDELIIPVIGGAFIGLIVITWWSSRNRADQTEDAPPAGESPDGAPNPPDDPAHYRLD